MSGNSVSILNVQKAFANGITALQDLTIDITGGEFLSVIGPSGCGKSTLLRLISKLDQPSSGKIISDNNRLGFVFQESHLLPWRKILENTSLPLELQGVSLSERNHAAKIALEQVGLKDFQNFYPAQLSGGMKMRASLARAMVTKPELLLLDEPFAALDEITRQILEEDLRRLWLSEKMTVIFVTHSISEACFLSNRALVLSPRPGRLLLDVSIPLPPERNADTRLLPEFSKTVGHIYHSLSTGMKEQR
jgi:NitT/TauT family transport system ATP-binding protein